MTFIFLPQDLRSDTAWQRMAVPESWSLAQWKVRSLCTQCTPAVHSMKEILTSQFVSADADRFQNILSQQTQPFPPSLGVLIHSSPNDQILFIKYYKCPRSQAALSQDLMQRRLRVGRTAVFRRAEELVKAVKKLLDRSRAVNHYDLDLNNFLQLLYLI